MVGTTALEEEYGEEIGGDPQKMGYTKLRFGLDCSLGAS